MNIKEMVNEGSKPVCACGSTEDVTFGPDPYASEICDDYTDVWECDNCRRESAEAI